MIYDWNINLLSKKSLYEQIDEISEGRYYLKDKNKWENQRKTLQENYYFGKITEKQYSEKARLLIQNVLKNINKVFISDNLPF